MDIDGLNAIIENGKIDEFVRVCEARQVKALSKIADEISGRSGIRLVLLAGASSAGKTTTAKRLATQLRVNGLVAMHLSTDDYFVGNSRNPRDENGEFDYERVDCVDMPRLSQDLNALLDGAKVNLRRFDFIQHEGFDSRSATSLEKGGVIILEGIHALNPILVDGVDDSVKCRVFMGVVMMTAPRRSASAISSARGFCPFVKMKQKALRSQRAAMRAKRVASSSDLKYAVSDFPMS